MQSLIGVKDARRLLHFLSNYLNWEIIEQEKAGINTRVFNVGLKGEKADCAAKCHTEADNQVFC